MNTLTRREAMGSIGAIAIGSGLARGALGANPDPKSLGWDESAGEYTLPELPYSYDALEPVIDEQTMRIHHDKHHAGYVKGLNGALSKLREIRNGSGDPGTTEYWMNKLSFNAGGHFNHTLFWTGMAPKDSGGGGEPSGRLAEAIRSEFGSFSKFSEQFRSGAKSVEGSGWGWLALEPNAGRLMILQMHNQQHSVFPSVVPLLGIDVWEHAYYLKYQNRRAEYVDAFMNIINWKEIGRRFEQAAG